MLSHERIWSAIDHLAQRNNLTASGLARRAGLDATSFNRSKRVSPDGRKRWPSTESLAKVLAATGATLDEFLRLIEPRLPASPPESRITVPVIDSGSVAKPLGADGLPGRGGMLQEMELPGLGEGCFAIEVRGGGLTPLYREGDVLVVCPHAEMRTGDRVVTCLDRGDILAAELRRRTPRAAELKGPLPGAPDRVIPAAEIAWMARVMWVRH
ncbi:DNA-binding protein [Methylobacterium indicum]|uniref:DNA-binding protein n=1 Tax=Methylobacterium indicum TaxID=1775910 RepID=A0A0J6QUF6_9HYPH|nr:helix-turn-helix transcriptional regulator [Methylobacterium indicum]KMO12767.1 DNA-binding protein [Methylobacterium indicum]KMO26815.1 DNA-binding protein [Methylobacterium indicum]KTS39537.1 DNA-binding protein [Methylobacterium indicum]KTS41714.1 DNA-binding protein [Methylobacterium indicum]KTS53547.1 DNA-binding protein [Methylobacterium indicum]